MSTVYQENTNLDNSVVYCTCTARKRCITSIKLITSAEREVKDSRHLGMYQSYNFLTRLGMQSLLVFGFIRLFDEVRAELVRDISRSLRFL